MSTAILTGPPVPGSSLDADLRALGFAVEVASGPRETAALLARVPAGQRVALVDPRFVGHRHSLRLGLTDPRFAAAAVPGALTARPEARPALARALDATAADTAATAPGAAHPGAGHPQVLTAPLTDTLADALDADGVTVHRPALGTLVAAVPDEPEARHQARTAVQAVDEEAVRLKSAVKAHDGFFTTFFISTHSRYLARWCARRGLTPNQVTTASLLTALLAAGAAATGERAGYVAAGVLLLLSFVLDCADGQLARYSLQYSTLGAWLDATFDRAKEYAFYAGLALGAARGGDDVWVLALTAMVLMTCRHVVDFSFNEANAKTGGGSASAGLALSDRLDSVGWTVWARRMIILPIGERWAMIAVLTAVTSPRVVFWALIVGCSFAACYTTAGRLLRSVRNRTPRPEAAARALFELTDTGPLAAAFGALGRPRGAARRAAPLLLAVTAVLLLAAGLLSGHAWGAVAGAAAYAVLSGLAVARPLTGPVDWLLPPLFRAGEYGTILVLAARADAAQAVPAAFGLVAAVAYHHYDTVYRIRGGTGAPPGWLVRAIGGQEGRTLVVTVLAALLAHRGDDFTTALTALAVAVGLVVLVESIRFWVSSGAPAVHDEGETA
ncbi:DUF5941 domain-containing protein [Streptomyces sp. NPDC090025]|uniref:DUF5941 domain-containing protein n=1 Tax=Streptomyces sp. NPDC090025 TaxID=3365922 RepID=UPI0038381E75